ncbi:MAG TPA: LuxR C-terminal-related transcriptional regulator [Trebonia sp.]|nr:LuxR C-terminal-related transcriptional regulator [Trebonia sp.]
MVPPGTRSAAAAARAPGAGGLVARRGLFELLAGPARVAVVSGPPGSGKTVLLRSWIGQAGLGQVAAWVTAGRDERDPQPFWVAVLDALRMTAPGSSLMQAMTAAPDLDGWAITERLLKDLTPLTEPLWLVIDDVHELGPDALRQLELLILRAPPELRLVLATRQDARLGLHRLRLEGELAEIREPDLRFSLDEARELLAAAGVVLSEQALIGLHERTEGWAAGLRLAALSLAGHPDPERFAAGFSGTDRTVAEYLLTEVLDRQSEPVRRLLLRTSVLERVNGKLADLLTGEAGGERVLQDLEQANAFVVSLDQARTGFRYHQMFAGLLRLELRRTAPDEVAGLHRAASAWFAGHGFAVDAVRHAQAAEDWETAAGLLAGQWPGLYLDGRAAVTRELLAGFPPDVRAADARLTAVAAAGELAYGSLDSAERHLRQAERESAVAPPGQRLELGVLLGIVRLLLARQRGNLPAVAEQARRLSRLDAAQPGPGEDLHALALISLGVAELWAARFGDAERHLERGVALAQRIGRPYLELTGLGHLALDVIYDSTARATGYARQAVRLAERHGWADNSATGIACAIVGFEIAYRGRLDEAEAWVQRAQRTLSTETEPAAAVGIRYVRGLVDLACGRYAEALAVLRAAEPLGRRLVAPHYLIIRTRAMLLHALVRLGEADQAEQALAGFGDEDRDRGEIRITTAMLRLAQGDPEAALAVLAPVIDGSAPLVWPAWMAQAFLVEALAKDALGDFGPVDEALEHALDCAEPAGALLWFLLYPVPDLLDRHARRRTAHAALITEIQSLLAEPPGAAAPRHGRGAALRLSEPLSDGELRVLRYLPTNLTAPEIARELSISRNTVKTHMRNMYSKLGTHRRSDAVARARDLGLLAPSASRR